MKKLWLVMRYSPIGGSGEFIGIYYDKKMAEHAAKFSDGVAVEHVINAAPPGAIWRDEVYQCTIWKPDGFIEMETLPPGFYRIQNDPDVAHYPNKIVVTSNLAGVVARQVAKDKFAAWEKKNGLEPKGDE